MTEWPQYSSSKVVRAAKITRIDETAGGLMLMVDPHGDGALVPFQATLPDMTARAEIGWWAMIYPDGFKSVSPAKQFEDGYTLVEPT